MSKAQRYRDDPTQYLQNLHSLVSHSDRCAKEPERDYSRVDANK